MQTASFYDQVTAESLIVKCGGHEVKDNAAKKAAEGHMKVLINDFDKMIDMQVDAVHLRLVSASGHATNSTYLVSHRCQDGTYNRSFPKYLHRFNEHGLLRTVGTRVRGPQGKYTYSFYPESQPYGAAPAPKLKPRQEERIKASPNMSMFHSGQAPYDGQVRLTYSFTNEFGRSLKKREVIDNATAYQLTPDTKKTVACHGFDPAQYTGKVFCFITQTDSSTTDIHYFACEVKDKSNKVDVMLSSGMVLKNWAPRKHLPIMTAHLGI